MSEYPTGAVSGALAYMFVQKLCERMERENILPTGEAKRIWTEILAELQSDNRVFSGECREAIVHHKLQSRSFPLSPGLPGLGLLARCCGPARAIRFTNSPKRSQASGISSISSSDFGFGLAFMRVGYHSRHSART